MRIPYSETPIPDIIPTIIPNAPLMRMFVVNPAIAAIATKEKIMIMAPHISEAFSKKSVVLSFNT